MNTSHLASLGERKALLSTRARLDRARLSLSLHEIRAIVHPAPDPARRARLRPTAAMLVSVAVPLLGLTRFRHWLRIASYASTAYRIASNWNRNR